MRTRRRILQGMGAACCCGERLTNAQTVRASWGNFAHHLTGYLASLLLGNLIR
jgi:hypothetical protein